MSWNRRIAPAVLAALCGWAVGPCGAAEVCPPRPEQPLRFVDVFDGAPDELAILIADSSGDRSGFWRLSYVYDAGRFVTVRCKYTDGRTLDVKLTDRVIQCDYEIDSTQVLILSCR